LLALIKGGDVDQAVIVVAGFVAEQHDWDLAGEEWRQSTGTDDFHMSGLGAAEKDAALEKLVPIARNHLLLPIDTGVYTKAFAEAALGSAKGRIRDPYRLCCLNCIIEVSEWARKENELPIDLVFDRDGKFASETSELYLFATKNPYLREKYKSGSIIQSDRKHARCLQIADALAHALFSYHRERMLNPNLPPGPHLNSILEKMPENGWLFTKPEEVEHWAQALQAAF